MFGDNHSGMFGGRYRLFTIPHCSLPGCEGEASVCMQGSSSLDTLLVVEESVGGTEGETGGRFRNLPPSSH